MLWLKYRKQEVWQCFMREFVACVCVLERSIERGMLSHLVALAHLTPHPLLRTYTLSFTPFTPTTALFTLTLSPSHPHLHPHLYLYLHLLTHTGTAAFIDAEHALDPVYAKNLGVNVDDLLVCQVR